MTAGSFSAVPDFNDSPLYLRLYSELPVTVSHSGTGYAVLQQLRAARAVQVAADELVARLLHDASKYTGGHTSITWEIIGAALGQSKQGAAQAHKRWFIARAGS